MDSRSWLVCLSLVAFPAFSAHAQAAGSVEGGVAAVWHNSVKPIDGRSGFGGTARLGVWLPSRFSIEGQIDVTRSKTAVVQAPFTLLYFAGSVLYNIPAGESGSVYLRAGYGLYKPSAACTFAAAPCQNFGAPTAALGFRLPIAGALNLRAEVFGRTRSTYSYTGVGFNVGITALRLRKSTERVVGTPVVPSGPVGPDEDGDGVPDRRDRCKATPPGALVDVRGCPTDYDGDGVYDGIDRCPGTPRGTAVDEVGCPLRKPPD